MSLAPGHVLSHYRLLETVGEGGMGVVWKAHDVNLGRDVAVKVLPEAFMADPERRARFEREARLLASLNHPHIASIYGFEAVEGVRLLAMELVEGEDLAARLRRGPLPIEDALRIARQVAEALEYAHEKGVIHRDLKPANVKLTAGGQVKVLDFGLAKALEEDRPAGGSDPHQSPTITAGMTGANVILGTAAYMSPEQARGHAADRRADIWAFGVVLVEMLTGRQLFEGETISDTLASVLKSDPDWSALPAGTPARVRALARRCLEKSPRQRLRDIGEARILLDAVLGGEPEEAAPAVAAAVAPRRAALLWAAAGLAAGALLVLGGVQLVRRPAAPPPLRKFELTIPGVQASTPKMAMLAPDGGAVAYFLGDTLWVQELAQLEPRKLGYEGGARGVFWSADSRHVGVLAGSRLARFAVAGGETQTICDTRDPFTGGSGAAWLPDGNIVFSRADSMGLMQVGAAGGDPRPLLRPEAKTESDLHEPSALPGGRGLLFVAHRRSGGANTIAVLSGGKRRDLLTLEGQWLARPMYSPTGHIVFRRTGDNPGVWAVPFSLSRLATAGEPFIVAPDAVDPSVAADGTLSYLPGSAGGLLQLAWAAPDGRIPQPIGEPVATDRFAAVSRDGGRIAFARIENNHSDLWVHDVARGTRTRLTFDPGDEGLADWSPDGRTVVYQAQVPNPPAGPPPWQVLLRPADGTGRPDTLARGALASFSPDGRTVIYTDIAPAPTNWQLWHVALDGDRKPQLFLDAGARLAGARIAPGGGLVAYMSNESGDWQVYLKRFPSGEGKWQVSAAGGQWPRWNGRGDRLYFVQGPDVLEVEVGGQEAPVLGTPRKLLTRGSSPVGNFNTFPAYGVTADGGRFLITEDVTASARTRGVTVVQSWFAEFARPRR